MTHKTQGIILRAIKYGETSLIVSAFTELFGVQSFIVNGVRSEKKEGSKAALYQPGTLLLMEIYFHESRSVNRIKECSRLKLLSSNSTDVLKNSVVIFIMELLTKCLKHPEKNEDLFYFITEQLEAIDAAKGPEIKGYPVHFLLHFAQHLGFGFIPPSEKINYNNSFFLDLTEGSFLSEQPAHFHFLSGKDAFTVADLLSGKESALGEIEEPGKLIVKILASYTLHAHDTGKLKSLDFLIEMLS